MRKYGQQNTKRMEKHVKPEYEKWVRENVPDAEALLKAKDPNDLLTAIDDLMLCSLGKNYQPTERTGEIARMYDAIFSDFE